MSQSAKPEFIFVFEDKIGGVAYLNKNLINNASRKDDVRVKVILLDLIDSNHARFSDTIKAEVIRFPYATYENKHAVLKRLAGLFGDGPGAIICNDGLEMEAIYQYGTNKTVYKIIHDFYNIKLSVKYGAIVDAYVTHTRLFRDILLAADPATVQSFCIDHGVTIPSLNGTRKNEGPINIVFTGRLVESKGVQELYHIDEMLRRRHIPVNWTIIGRGPLKDQLLEQWKGKENVKFASPDTNEDVLELMASNELFILPTRFEGSPVTVLEALGTGLVPIISDLPGGITEIITKEVGVRVPIGNIEGFADAITDFYKDRGMLQRMSAANRHLAEERFDIMKTSNNYFALFGRYEELKKPGTNLPPIPVGFKLDAKWLPNSVVSLIRRKLKAIK